MAPDGLPYDEDRPRSDMVFELDVPEQLPRGVRLVCALLVIVAIAWVFTHWQLPVATADDPARRQTSPSVISMPALWPMRLNNCAPMHMCAWPTASGDLRNGTTANAIVGEH